MDMVQTNSNYKTTKTMKYVVVERDFIDLSQFYHDLVELVLEIADDGRVLKEIGLNKDKSIIHVFPSRKYEYGKYGIFDSNLFDASLLTDELQSSEFYSYWNLL